MKFHHFMMTSSFDIVLQYTLIQLSELLRRLHRGQRGSSIYAPGVCFPLLVSLVLWDSICRFACLLGDTLCHVRALTSVMLGAF